MAQSTKTKQLATGARRPSRASSFEVGSVVIECVLVLPLLLVMFGYTMRLTQLLQANQIAMELSREAATEAFRACTDLTILNPSCPGGGICIDSTKTTAAMNNCIIRVKNKFEAQWAVARPTSNRINEPASIDVEVYRYNLASITRPANCVGAADPVTRSSTNIDLPPLSTSVESLCRRSRVARARISFQARPTIAFINLLPGFHDSPFTVVDDTVM